MNLFKQKRLIEGMFRNSEIGGPKVKFQVRYLFKHGQKCFLGPITPVKWANYELKLAKKTYMGSVKYSGNLRPKGQCHDTIYTIHVGGVFQGYIINSCIVT